VVFFGGCGEDFYCCVADAGVCTWFWRVSDVGGSWGGRRGKGGYLPVTKKITEGEDMMLRRGIEKRDSVV